MTDRHRCEWTSGWREECLKDARWKIWSTTTPPGGSVYVCSNHLVAVLESYTFERFMVEKIGDKHG